jgi:hypothetical protein
MPDTATSTTPAKAEPKEKDPPSAPPKSENKDKTASTAVVSDDDDSDSSSDDDGGKDPEGKAKKKEKKSHKKEAKGSAGGKPKSDAGQFARSHFSSRQERTDQCQQESTLTRNTTPTSLPKPLVRFSHVPIPITSPSITIASRRRRRHPFIARTALLTISRPYSNGGRFFKTCPSRKPSHHRYVFRSYRPGAGPSKDLY